MPIAKMKFIKNFAEFIPRDKRKNIPQNTRGIYFLFNKNNKEKITLLYVGMAHGDKAGIRGRLNSHAKSKKLGTIWTHFSLLEVHDNISSQEIEELEGLFRHIYRFDTAANSFNRQRRHYNLRKVRNNNLEKW